MNRKDVAERELVVARAYRALFLDETGNLTQDAEMVMRDIEAKCGWMNANMPVGDAGMIDPLRLAADTARRKLYAHIKGRLFGPLDQLKRITENLSD